MGIEIKDHVVLIGRELNFLEEQSRGFENTNLYEERKKCRGKGQNLASILACLEGNWEDMTEEGEKQKKGGHPSQILNVVKIRVKEEPCPKKLLC